MGLTPDCWLNGRLARDNAVSGGLPQAHPGKAAPRRPRYPVLNAGIERHILNSGTKVLLAGLRAAGEGEKSLRRAQIDAVLRFGSNMFGQACASPPVWAVEFACRAKTPRGA